MNTEVLAKMFELLHLIFGTYFPLRMDCNNLDDSLTFHQAPPSGQMFLSSTFIYDRIPAK